MLAVFQTSYKKFNCTFAKNVDNILNIKRLYGLNINPIIENIISY